ncbi:MAG: hypothetical protein QHH00_04240 [Methanomassiliicoccales archaeon]|nr:hypothetical protein [Methanomassiliicoccales archaeon]
MAEGNGPLAQGSDVTPSSDLQPPQKGKKVQVVAAIAVVIVLVVAVVIVVENMSFLFNIGKEKEIAPVYPEESAIITNSTPTFEWEGIPGISSYRFQLSLDIDFDHPIIDIVVNGTSYTIDHPLEENRSYFWRLMPYDTDEAEWTPVWDFFIGYNVFTRTYNWEYEGNSWSLTVNIPGDDYYEYSTRARSSNYASYVISNDPVIYQLAYKLNNMAEKEGYENTLKAEFVLAFVQSLPYFYDNESKGVVEYPRYPIETLVDNGGDCEDTAILFVSLIQTEVLNFDGILLLFTGDPSHMAAGIWVDSSIPGVYYFYHDKSYYYCETTSEGWGIGEVPGDYEGRSARVIDC